MAREIDQGERGGGGGAPDAAEVVEALARGENSAQIIERALALEPAAFDAALVDARENAALAIANLVQLAIRLPGQRTALVRLLIAVLPGALEQALRAGGLDSVRAITNLVCLVASLKSRAQRESIASILANALQVDGVLARVLEDVMPLSAPVIAGLVLSVASFDSRTPRALIARIAVNALRADDVLARVLEVEMPLSAQAISELLRFAIRLTGAQQERFVTTILHSSQHACRQSIYTCTSTITGADPAIALVELLLSLSDGDLREQVAWHLSDLDVDMFYLALARMRRPQIDGLVGFVVRRPGLKHFDLKLATRLRDDLLQLRSAGNGEGHGALAGQIEALKAFIEAPENPARLRALAIADGAQTRQRAAETLAASITNIAQSVLKHTTSARLATAFARVYYVPNRENLRDLFLAVSYKVVGLPIYLVQTADNARAHYQQSGLLHASYTTAQEFITTWAPYALTFAANPIVASVGAVAVTARQGYALYQDAAHLLEEYQDEVASWKAWVNVYENLNYQTNGLFRSQHIHAKARLWIAERELEVRTNEDITSKVWELFWTPAFNALKAEAVELHEFDFVQLEQAAGLMRNVDGYDACLSGAKETICYVCKAGECEFILKNDLED